VLLKEGLEKVIVRSWRRLVMGLSFSAGNAAVAMATKFRDLEALFLIVKEIVGKIVRF